MTAEIFIVDDNADIIIKISKSKTINENFCIGSGYEISNLDLVYKIIEMYVDLYPNEFNYNDLISFVDDRKGHDFRYSIDSSKIQSELDWSPKMKFEEGIKRTINWFKNKNQ